MDTRDLYAWARPSVDAKVLERAAPDLAERRLAVAVFLTALGDFMGPRLYGGLPVHVDELRHRARDLSLAIEAGRFVAGLRADSIARFWYDCAGVRPDALGRGFSDWRRLQKLEALHSEARTALAIIDGTRRGPVAPFISGKSLERRRTWRRTALVGGLEAGDVVVG